jgi:methionine-S-sulfoxide reductase
MDEYLKKATFAGGCFWCMQPPFQQTDGVVEAVAGYTGGTKENPTYEEVSAGRTGHLEAVEVTYDPAKVTYGKLLAVFWSQIDPTDPEGQFADQGSQYRTAIFYHDEEQKAAAERSKKDLDASGKFSRPVATAIRPAMPFYRAEEYHQNYAEKQPQRYKEYKKYSGREAFIGKVWGGEDKGSAGGKAKVIVYSTPRCHNCREIKEFLKAKNIPFEEIDLATSAQARNEIIEKTGHISAPIVRIGDEFIFGYDPKRMEQLLGQPGGRPDS